MSERRRARITAAIALAIHAGVLVGMRAARVPPRAIESAPADVDIEIAVIAPSAPEIEVPQLPPEEKPVAARSSGGFRSAEPAAAATSSEAGEVRESDVKESAPVALLMDPAPANIGIANGGGTNPFLMNAPSITTLPSAAPAGTAMREQSAEDAKKKVEGSMRASQRQRDVALGLGPDGPVLRALRDSTYTSIAPNRGKAIFLAVVDASGSIVDVKLVSTNGDDRAWRDALERAKKALAGQKLALRGAKGAEVKIEVSSDIRLPSGNKPGDFPIQPKLESSHIGLHEGAPSAGTADTVQAWTLAGFDLSDIGAKPRRIVHARVLEARFF